MSLYDQGDFLYSQHKYPEAYSLFAESLKINKDDTNSINYLGCCELMLGNYISALNWFDKVIDLEPSWERPLFNKGRVYLKLGQNYEAYIWFLKAIDMNPKCEDSFYYLGVFYEQIGNLESAEEAYRKSLEIEQDQEETLQNHGFVLYKLRQYNEALLQFQKALSINPENKDVLWGMHDIYYIEKNNIKTQEILLRLDNLYEDKAIKLNIGILFAKQKDFTNAKNWIDKAIRMDPLYENALNAKEILLKQPANLTASRPPRWGIRFSGS